ncbi:cell wall elongation regulator TseB-like domain-containing protein [Loigolactobacillus zhaoyuanensis]|uniref:DUF5590 domain-containing protein n=1 Tax=Loigolactobacillus zhaoyuanensis TaxID=2486017 RepID=A0ABW8UC21_9LACO|nr:DUF5590 domain-containing protein [Loigolactobacillus zhaoyuanensis]
MRKHWKSYSLIGVILVIIVSALFIYHAANKPAVTARREAVTLAKKYGHVTTVDDFYWFNRKQSYLTVAGQTKQQPVFVIIAQKGGKITVLNQSSGISRNTALKQVWRTQAPKKVYNATLGLYQKKPVWEIAFADKNGHLGYQTLDFKTGKSVKLIKNI